MVLMPEAVIRYVNSGGSTCPYCKSTRLDAYNQQIATEGRIFFDCACRGCHREWKEQYTLTDITSIQESINLEVLNVSASR